MIRLKKRLVPHRARAGARVLLTAALAPRERRRAAAFARRGPVRLHLGSHLVHKDGWVNVDLAGIPVDLAWDITGPLPFPDGSVDAIFHEHVVEHLSLADGFKLTLDCHRVMKPGGVLRVAAPNVGETIRLYDADPERLLRLFPGRPTAFLAAQEIFYSHGHRTMYDEETLDLLLRAGGFPAPEVRSFGDSRIVPCPDTEGRRGESFYMEAVRP